MAETSQERLEFERKLYKQNRGMYAPNRNSPGHPANQPVPQKTQKKKLKSKKSGTYARKGGPVGHRVGEQVTPNSMGGNLGGGAFGGPQMKPSIPSPQVPKQAASKEKPPSPQDTMNQKIDAVNKASKAEADQSKYKKMASLGQPQGQPQVPGQPQGQPQAPGKPQPQRPPVSSRKGDTVKTQGYRGGGKVYSNACRAANNPVA